MVDEFSRGVKEAFDWLMFRSANHYHGNPKIQARCDVENDWLTECAKDMLHDLSPDDYTEWLNIRNLVAERDALKLKVERLIGAGETCAAELYAWVNDHYEKTADYPSEARRKARDMQPVIDLRTAIDEARK